MTTITSRQHALVHRYRAAARRAGDPEELLLDGAHLVREALAARVPLEIVTVTAAARDDREVAALLPALAYAGAQIHVASESVMEAISPVKAPTGIVALGRLGSAEVGTLFAPAPALVAAVVGVQDPGNVGAIVRAAAGAGATGVAVADGSAHPFGWKALRGSQGVVFRLPVARVSVPEAVAAARRAGVRVLAAVPRGGRSMYDVDLRRPCLLWLGGEGPGLGADVVAAADECVEIPMAAPVESLNVAVAAGILLFEARRQRTGTGTTRP